MCLLIVSQKDAGDGIGRCDPSKDPRSREFLLYDRATGQAGVFGKYEHPCGGA